MIEIDIIQQKFDIDIQRPNINIDIQNTNIDVDINRNDIDVNVIKQDIEVDIQGAIVNFNNTNYVELTAICGEDISALRCIYISNDGKAYIASSDNINIQNVVVGVTNISATTSNSIRYIASGYLKNTAFNFDTLKPIFLGSNGNLTQISVSSGINQIIGKAISNNEILIDIKQSIRRG